MQNVGIFLWGTLYFSLNKQWITHEVAENAKSGINHPNNKTATVIRSVKLVFRLLCNINNGKLKNNVDSLMV